MKKFIIFTLAIIVTFFFTSIQTVFLKKEILKNNINQLLTELGDKKIETKNGKIEYFSPFFGRIFFKENYNNEICIEDIDFTVLKYNKDLKYNIYIINSYLKNNFLLNLFGIYDKNKQKYCFYNYNKNKIFVFYKNNIYYLDKNNKKIYIYIENNKYINEIEKNKLIKLKILKEIKKNNYYLKYKKTWDK